MKNINKWVPIFTMALFAPAVALAQNLQGVLGVVRDLLNLIIPILITLAVIYFFWGVAQFILSANDPEARSEGRSKMIYGIIALFVIVFVWGLVQLVGNTFSIGRGSGPATAPILPQ